MEKLRLGPRATTSVADVPAARPPSAGAPTTLDPRLAPLAALGGPPARLSAPSSMVPLDAVSAVIQGASGPPTAGGPATAHQALHRARDQARHVLEAGAPLAVTRLDVLLDEGRASLALAKTIGGKTAGTLAQAYVHLAEAETFAQAVLDEATEGASHGDEAARGEAGARADAARGLLREIGAHYAVRCPEFTRLMLGDAEWPTRYEKVDGQLHYINGFKSKTDLDPAGALAAFETRLQDYLKAGGSMSAIKTLSRESLDQLEVGEKYEYVLTTTGEFRFTIIPKAGDGPSPGHTLTAEASYTYAGVRALCAGEVWVSRGSDGELSAVCISAGSGHYKPYFDSLSTVDPPLTAMGVDQSLIVHYGGPSSARDAARKLFEKAGVEGETRLPPRVHELRLALRNAER